MSITLTARMEDHVKAFDNTEVALRAYGITTAQLAALCTSNPALEDVAKRISQLIAPDGSMSYKLLYPSFDKSEMPSKIRDALIHRGITDIGALQMHTVKELQHIGKYAPEELQHIGKLSPGAIQIIKEYLKKRRLRLRYQSETRHDRLRKVYPNASLVPVLFLPVDADELKLYGIHTYGDLAGCKKSELIKLKLKSSYEGDLSLCFTTDEVSIIEAELNFFGLNFIPEE